MVVSQDCISNSGWEASTWKAVVIYGTNLNKSMIEICIHVHIHIYTYKLSLISVNNQLELLSMNLYQLILRIFLFETFITYLGY